MTSKTERRAEQRWRESTRYPHIPTGHDHGFIEPDCPACQTTPKPKEILPRDWLLNWRWHWEISDRSGRSRTIRMIDELLWSQQEITRLIAHINDIQRGQS